MQAEEVQQVEALVNQWIQEEHTLEVKEVPIAEAKAAGACLPTAFLTASAHPEAQF